MRSSYVIYSLATGDIRQVISVNPELLEMNTREGESALPCEQGLSTKGYRVFEGAIVPIPFAG